ncbi:MAG TPA: N-6 DNA methylase [Bacteroidota bacterium]|nr:N-6 DNA methylase [Bacteroidota bacterium]
MSQQSPFKSYFNELQAVARQGDAREESFYPALAEMLKAVADSTGRKEVRVTTLPKGTDAGNPDFRLWNGVDRIIGYVEAKKPSESNLASVEETEQLRRYRATFPNLILTNFFEFRLYRNGVLVQMVYTARPNNHTRGRNNPVHGNAEELQALLDRFLDFSLPKVFTAESLAVELAKRTRFLREVVGQQIIQEQEKPGVLAGFFEAFQTYLIGTLTPMNFADLFAQTITYGLFAARTRAGESFNRRAAFDYIPHTIGVLRDLFRFISLSDLPEQMAWCVDDIAEVLGVADAPGILDRYYHEGKGSDPIVHFYETFLAQYDPAERERRGVYYTPEPVVGYIVRSIHNILKTEFSKRDGLASDSVTLLDPAAGTMTFIARAAEQAVSEFKAKYGDGGSADFIRDHILKNFYAFELMMAPYAVGHLKMSFFLEELGHRLTDDERVPFYLTNTLDNEELAQTEMPFYHSLAEESRLAGAVKKQAPILVILGNPPYSGHSTNMGEWIRGLIESYKMVDGNPLGEKNPKWLQDDYVKFLRFAQWKIEQGGRGIVGMITNHSYLDNPTFRGMRQSLMRTFDEIYILDLHGNTLKKETCADGSPDKNVFDIRQGVAIAFFVKHISKNKADAIVRHAEIYGSRESKYDWLNSHDRKNSEWKVLMPSSPFYLFIPSDNTLGAIYQENPSVPEIFPVNSVGLVTARDNLTIHWTPDEVWKTVTVFSGMEPERARHEYALGKDARDWKVALAQKDLLDSGPKRTKIAPILYRPFDVRHTYYTARSRGFICMPRPEVMRHMLGGKNIALASTRNIEIGGGFRHVFCTTELIQHHTVSMKEVNYIFPLYVKPVAEKEDLFTLPGTSELCPNLNSDLINKLISAYGEKPTPESVFHYVYAILYAPSYRARYAEYLKMDFPRIPFTKSDNLFGVMAQMGERLVKLHLLNSPDLDPPICRFEGKGSNRIEKGRSTGLRYEAAEERVYINSTQYFAPVSESVWNYQIGGYQVCERWLKDRKDRRLELDEIRTYCRIVTAIARTIELQEEIDRIYPKVEKSTIKMPITST